MSYIDPQDEPPDAARESGDMFESPVPVPAANIDDGPLRCVQFNESYARYFALAIERLAYYDAWTGTDADVQRVTQQVESFIGDLLTGNCP